MASRPSGPHRVQEPSPDPQERVSPRLRGALRAPLGGTAPYRSATAVGVTGCGSSECPVSQVSAAAAAARPSAIAHTISD
jgi:hypothetical protein